MTRNPVLLSLLIVAAWFLVFVCVHVLGFRYGRRNAQWLVGSYITCCAITLLNVLAMSLWRDGGETMALSLLIAALISACLFVLYTPAVYTVLTSLSVATLILLLRNGGHMPEESLYSRFATRAILRQRLSVLVNSGYLVEDAGGFRLTPRGRFVARCLQPSKNSGAWGRADSSAAARIYAREGGNLDRATLVDWVGKTAAPVSPWRSA